MSRRRRSLCSKFFDHLLLLLLFTNKPGGERGRERGEGDIEGETANEEVNTDHSQVRRCRRSSLVHRYRQVLATRTSVHLHSATVQSRRPAVLHRHHNRTDRHRVFHNQVLQVAWRAPCVEADRWLPFMPRSKQSVNRVATSP